MDGLESNNWTNSAQTERALTQLVTKSPVTHNVTEDEMSRLRRMFRAYERNKVREITEQRDARRYYNCRQWTEEEINILRRRKQPIVTDNRIARKIDFLVGVEQRMRRDPKAAPRTPMDEKGADTATAGVRFACDINNWEQLASHTAHDGFTNGIGVIWLGEKRCKEGYDPHMKHVEVDRFFYDPRSMLPDFSDARYMGVHLWLDVEDVKTQYPDLADQIDDLIDRTGGVTIFATEEDHAEQWGDFERKRVRVVEMYEKRPMENSPSGTAWFYTKFSGSVMFDQMWSPYLDDYGLPDCPYMAWSPYVDERGDRYGLIRNMKSMQDEINHRRSKLLHRTSVRQVQMQKGVVEDVDYTREQLAKPDGIVEHAGEWGVNIGIIDDSKEIKGETELLLQAESSLENLGPNPGLIGKGGGVADQSGRAILAQRDSGMTELSPVFDRLRDWKLRVYRKMWSRIKQLWTGDRWIRITDDNNAPAFLGLNQPAQYDPQTGEMIQAHTFISEIDVDIIMEEGPDVVVMQEELMQTLSQLGEAALTPLGKLMIELSNVPQKDRLLKLLDKANAPDPATAQMQARLARLEEMLKAATVDEKVAAVEAKRAETMAKLASALQPKEQPLHKETGMPMGPPPADPMQSVMSGLQALQMFPLQYGAPTLEQISLNMPDPQPPEPDGDEQGQQMPQGGPMMPGQQMMPPNEQQMPGGLPVSPEVSGMQGY